MRTMILAAVAALGVAGAAAAQDAAMGTWQTEVDGEGFGYVQLTPCGAAICGKVTRTFDAAGNPVDNANIGRQIVIDMVPNGDGSYNGQVFRPSNGKTYVGKMEVSGNTLRLRGCVAGGLICASQNWARVK